MALLLLLGRSLYFSHAPYTSVRSLDFCAMWVCISPSPSSSYLRAIIWAVVVQKPHTAKGAPCSDAKGSSS
jgi:hypothetical protein